MQELKLNPYQYSKLVDVPYEIVKNVIYDSDVGGYNMEIKNFFRKKLFEKHQEIENDYQNAQLKATQIKLDEIRQAQINGDVDKVKELTEKYYEEKYEENEMKKFDYKEWANNFDIEKFMKIHYLTNRDLAEKLNKAYSTTCLFTSKKIITTPIARDFYDYVNSISTTIEEPIEEQIDEPSEVLEVEMKKDNVEEVKEMIKEDVEKEEINEITQNDVLRNLLINRLTEEEKTLIRLFGGKV